MDHWLEICDRICPAKMSIGGLDAQALARAMRGSDDQDSNFDGSTDGSSNGSKVVGPNNGGGGSTGEEATVPEEIVLAPPPAKKK